MCEDMRQQIILKKKTRRKNIEVNEDEPDWIEETDRFILIKPRPIKREKLPDEAKKILMDEVSRNRIKPKDRVFFNAEKYHARRMVEKRLIRPFRYENYPLLDQIREEIIIQLAKEKLDWEKIEQCLSRYRTTRTYVDNCTTPICMPHRSTVWRCIPSSCFDSRNEIRKRIERLEREHGNDLPHSVLF